MDITQQNNNDECKIMVDISKPEFVEIQLAQSEDGLRIWVNVDGRCRFRAYRVEKLYISEDSLKELNAGTRL